EAVQLMQNIIRADQSTNIKDTSPANNLSDKNDSGKPSPPPPPVKQASQSSSAPPPPPPKTKKNVIRISAPPPPPNRFRKEADLTIYEEGIIFGLQIKKSGKSDVIEKMKEISRKSYD